MLRRLLSNPLPMNGKVDEELGATDEPREYFLLSKMQPLPPEEVPQGDLQNYWYQSNYGNNNNNIQPFSTVENDVYWPNCIPIDQYTNGNDNIISISSSNLPPPQPAPLFYTPVDVQIPPTKNILEEKNYQNGDNSNNLVFEFTQEGLQLKQDAESLRKMSTTSNGDGIERNGESPFFDSDNNSNSEAFYCHYCNRSFPRFRISPRRHIAQCRRLNINEDFNNQNVGSSSCGALMENFGSNNQQQNISTSIDFSSLNTNNSCSSTSPTPAPGGIGSVDPSDPYQCSWCQFNTLYKGNMKRHLICCHQVSLDLLINLNFNIERLRKLSTSRPSLDELPIQPRRDGKDYTIKEEINLQNNFNQNFDEKRILKTPKNNLKRKISTERRQQNNKIIKIEQQQQKTSTINDNYTSSSTIKFAPYI
ncbi:hypothetical protein ACQ4LE_008052 [Meloidogyne hapla]|uniref:C2H2-type domain-containing protein n=1 Tax=Meloidogyne hapla TaxID=6305 RepID=A0A1I8BJU4_MELHA